MKTEVSIIVNTKNAAKTLQRALESAKFAKEIILVDMESTDDTLAIAKKYTSKIFKHKDVGYVEPARNFAIQKASCDWVMILDADEVIPEDLKNKVSDLLESKSDIICYYVPRKNIIFGKWVEKIGWWPDFQPRIFKKDRVLWKDGVHSEPIISGNTEYLPSQPELAITHYNYDSVSDFLQRLDRYTTVAAADDDPEKSSVTGKKLIQTFSDELLRRLFLEHGMDEGVHGVGLSFLQSMYQMVVQLKKWELQKDKQVNDPQSESLLAMKQFQEDLSYWMATYQIQHSSGAKKFFWQVRRKLKI